MINEKKKTLLTEINTIIIKQQILITRTTLLKTIINQYLTNILNFDFYLFKSSHSICYT